MVEGTVDVYGWGDAWVCRFGEEDLADDQELDLDGDHWDDPDWVRRLMVRIDAEVQAREDPESHYMRWLREDRQHRINDWGATFFQAAVRPPDGWEDWVA
jgi:hypothetical protein